MKSFIFPIIVCIVFLLIACETVKKEKMPGTTYLFYPLQNIYFDQDNKEYYYYDSVKAVWQTTATLSPEISARLGKYVLLDSVALPVYRDNSVHRMIHGSILYSSPGEIQRKYREDSLASLPKKDTLTNADSIATKKRSRIGRWFQKVFGKKDK